MQGQKRIRLEIMSDILSLCKKPQTKTRIMYSTNLSYKTLQSYLSQLESLAFLDVHHSVVRYTTTEKGLVFLEKWSELKKLLISKETPIPNLEKQQF